MPLPRYLRNLAQRTFSDDMNTPPKPPPLQTKQLPEPPSLDHQETSPTRPTKKMSQRLIYRAPPIHTSTLSLLRIYVSLLTRIRLYLADPRNETYTPPHIDTNIRFHQDARLREVYDDSIGPEFYKAMCRFVYLVRDEREETEEKWAERVAGKIEELEGGLGREREVLGEGVVWRWYVDVGRSRRHSC